MSRIRFSQVAGMPLVATAGNQVGRVADCVVRLVESAVPRVTGILLRLGGEDVFVSADDVADLSASPLRLATVKVDTRPFERRRGEVLLGRDVCSRTVIDVSRARLVRVSDLVLQHDSDGWHVVAVVASPTPGVVDLLRRVVGRPRGGAEEIEWSRIEPLVGHVPTAARRLPFLRLAQLRPADIADLVEAASHDEGSEILDAVHEDQELEADVFEELNREHQVEFLSERSDKEAAAVLASMEPDAGADVLMALDQDRRRPILDLLPPDRRADIRTLLGYGPESAGGLMSTEFIALPVSITVAEALERLRELDDEPAIVTDVVVVEDGRLTGTVTLWALIRADPSARLGDVMRRDPVAVYPDADLPSVAVEMADYNLSALPVVAQSGQLLGIVTYDDLVEAMLPAEWRWRGRPEQAHLPSAGTTASGRQG